MSKFEEQIKDLSPEEQVVTLRIVEASQALYGAAETQLLEGLGQTEGRLRDGFDALVMITFPGTGNPVARHRADRSRGRIRERAQVACDNDLSL